MAGYRVVESADTQTAMRELESRKIDVVLAGLDLPSEAGHSLPEEMRRLPGLARVPALALIDSAEQAEAHGEPPQGFSGCQLKFDRDAMLHSLAKLAGAVGRPEALAPAGEKGGSV